MTDYKKYNTNLILEAAMKDPEMPGNTHPGYFQPIGKRNIWQENLAAMGWTPEMEQIVFDMSTGSGAPMAIGSVAKGGKSLLNSLLEKMRTGKKLTASEKKLAPQAFDLAVDRMDKAIDLEKATKKFTKMRNKYIDDISDLDEGEFYKKLQDFEIDFNPYSPEFDAKKLNELFDAGSYNQYIDNKWGPRSKWGQENIRPIDAPTLEQAKKAGTLGPEMTLDEFFKKLN